MQATAGPLSTRSNLCGAAIEKTADGDCSKSNTIDNKPMNNIDKQMISNEQVENPYRQLRYYRVKLFIVQLASANPHNVQHALTTQ